MESMISTVHVPADCFLMIPRTQCLHKREGMLAVTGVQAGATVRDVVAAEASVSHGQKE